MTPRTISSAHDFYLSFLDLWGITKNFEMLELMRDILLAAVEPRNRDSVSDGFGEAMLELKKCPVCGYSLTTQEYAMSVHPYWGSTVTESGWRFLCAACDWREEI